MDTVHVMPIVLATAEGAEASGYTYDDKTGVSYEYPNRYKNQIVTGDAFVYHKKGGGYIGVGVIGEIHSSETAGRWICDILQYKPFGMPVPLKAVDGFYFEAQPDIGKEDVYFAQGVRAITEERFELLLETAGVNDEIGGASPPSDGGGYASKEVAELIERVSVDAAIAWLAERYPGHEIKEMPHNNPRFDVRVGPPNLPVLYVEVKGTQSASPSFWMSEGERLFSIEESARYLLIVVAGIDLTGEHAAVIHVRPGAVEGSDFELAPSQWRGTLLLS